MMTNLLHGAHVANKLFSTIARLRLLLVMFLTLCVSANVWGAEVTFTTTSSGGFSNNSKTANGVTVKFNGSPSWQSGHVRVYSKATISFSSTNNNITKIVMTATSTDYAKTWSADVGSTDVNNTTITWTGSAKSITLTNTASAQSRLSKIVVTTADAHTVTWTINPAAGGSLSPTSGTSTTVTPNVAYTYDSPAYTVTPAGKANVSQDGDNFTATPSANCTIQINMVEKTPATISFENMGNPTPTTTGYYVGDTYTLPATNDYTCGDKTFVGWSTVEIDNSAEKPTSNFHERGASVTLGATNTFYAVFAETGGTPTTTWPKTEIANIKSTDEVVITMSNGVTTWALRNDDGTSAAPYAESITITNEQISSKVGDVQIWNISNSSGNLTIYPKGGTSTWLYCTNTNNGVRVGTNENKTFTISGNYLKNTATSRYVGVYVTNPDWRCYDNTAGNIAGQTLAFYKKTTTSGYQNYTTSCSTETSPSLNADPTSLAFGNVATDSDKEMTFTLTGSNLTANASLQLSGINPGMFSLSSNSVTQSAGSINQTITVTYTPSTTGSHNATLTISSTGAESKTVTLSGTGVAPAPTHTVTFNAGSGTCDDESLTETSGGAGVTLPIATPSATCQSEGWTFAGWWTEEVSSTNTSPGTLMKAGDTYNPNSDITLYAVYSTQETGDAFTGYAKVTTAPDDWSGKYLLSTGEYTATGAFDSDGTSGHLVRTTYTPGNEEKAEWEFTLAKVGNTGYSILFPDGSWYLGHDDGTDFGRSIYDPVDNAAYLWTPSTNGITNVFATSRKIADNGSADFRPYSSPSSGVVYLYKRIGGGTTTIYNSNPSCEVCENILTINKGAETNGTFTLSKSGEIETCDGDVVVTVSEISPAEHYSVSAVTATAPTTGDAPTVTNKGDGTWTVTYAQYSQGESTINVTFVEDAKATITLSELGVPTIDNTTYYVGETYTLPSTSSQSCDGKQLVGWSRVEVAETDTKPTENYYELGAEVTLAATQTFYAVFATEGGVPSTDYNQITSIEDLTDGNYVIAYGYNITSPTIILKAETKDETTLVATSAGPTDNKYTDPAASNIWEIKKTNTTYTLYNAATSKYIQATNTPSLKLADADPTEFQISYSSDHWKIKLNTANTYQLVGYTNASGNYFQTKESPSGSYKIQLYKSASTVVYTAYTTSCVPTYSITYDFAGGTGSHCSNTSVPQGDSYTICEEEPIKEGHTFQGWSDGTSTYAAGTTITPTKNTTLTAQWQIKTYTVTWSNNGATTPVTYQHGDDLTLPSTPESCDGVKEFVGWTADNTFTYHATTPPSDIFTEKTATVTANATYYAVFATPPGTGGGGGGSETTTTLDFTAQGYADATAISNLTVDGVTATFAKGSNSNAPKYYTNGTAIRAYGGNTITLSANQITAATFTFGDSDGSNGITADCGSWVSPTWTGDATDEVVFTIGGTSGNRRIQSIEVTCTSGGGSGSYSDYTTTCQQVESIVVTNPKTDFLLTEEFTIGEGTVTAKLSGEGTADVTALATFSGYNMEVVGTYTVTVTYMGATATYNINVKPLDNAWVLTWNVSGKTNTGLGPRYVNKGSAIGTLPTPVVPDACEGKTFMGWTTSNIVNSDGTGITYINEGTVPTDNTTYYAVFATVNNFCTQKPIDQIAPGSKVVIVAVASLDAGGTTGKAISSRTSDDGNNLAGDEVSIYDNTINTPHSTCIWTLYKDGEQYYFKQGDYFLNAVDEEGYTNLKWNETKELWNITSVPTYLNTYYMESTHVPDTYIEWYIRRLCFKTYYDIENENGEFDMQFFVTANANGGADITDYTTGCTEYTITYYGFRGGYSTSTSSDGIIVLPVNSMHTVPNCGDVVTDHTNLGREFLNVWMTQPHGGHTFEPGDTFILTQDTTLYAQWKMETTSDVTTLPTDIEDLAGTDVYVYGGKTLNIQPGTTTINSLTLKGGLQSDGSYKMPIVWVPEGATLVRNSNKIYLDLKVNAKNYYPFAVPFATKNDQYIDYLDPVLNAASTYDKHFVIKTYNGALRATNGEDRANNWVKVLRHATDKPSYLQPGVGYIIQALTYPDKDTATIRIPMTVPNTWFENGEQAVVGTTVRNTIAVTAHAGAAATEHPRHAGWNFVASPYLTNFAGGNVENNGGLEYINGELTVNGGWQYGGEEVPYVTIPAYDFSYYTQHKLSDVKLSPEWSFFVQIGKDGTMDFSTAGRQETPASIAARHDAAQSFKMDVDITLSDKNHSDQMGLIICDRFTSAYEVGYDLEKMFGSAYNLTVYTLMEDNTPLAYHALAIHSNMQVIPVGYRVPEQGDYTFALNQSTSSIDLLNEQYEQLILVDYETGALTNLLNSTYTFTSPRTQSDSRFAIYAVIRQKTPTDLPNIDDGDTSTRKILHNGHLYILRDGKVYNGHGQIVK